MAKETKTEKIEREYTIPLREKCRVVPRYKKANKAVKTIKEFVARHMKIRDRDLKKVRLDMYLNEAVWFRGIRKPPAKIKVKVIKEGDIVRVELADMPAHLKFKKARLEKMEKGGEKSKKKTEEKVETEKNADEVKAEKDVGEKIDATVEAGEKMEKSASQKLKHETKVKQGKQERTKMTNRGQ